MTTIIHFDQRGDQGNDSISEEGTMSQPVETRQDTVEIVGMDLLVTSRDKATAGMTEQKKKFDDGSTSISSDEDSLVLTRRRLRPIYDCYANDAEEDSLVLVRRRGLSLRNRGARTGPLDTSHKEEAELDHDLLLKFITPETQGGLSKLQRLHVRYSSEPLLLRRVSRCVA